MMGDVGELLAAVVVLFALAYYRWPWFRALFNRKPLTTTPSPTHQVMSNKNAHQYTNTHTPPDSGVCVVDENEYPVPGDITRYSIVKLLVASGWSVSQMRSYLKGDYADIGREAERAKAELEAAGVRIGPKRKAKPRPKLMARST